MSAVDEIQAAIKRAKNVKTILGHVEVGKDPKELYARVEEDEDGNGNRFSYGLVIGGVDSDEEINEAIVTLHATIDAQLAILRDSLTVGAGYVEAGVGDLWSPTQGHLALARAINGATHAPR